MMKTAMLDSWTLTMPITATPAGEHGPSASLRVTDRCMTAPADAVLSPTSLRSGLKSKEGTSDPAWSTRVGIS
jgi:hypothetical protein